ncbi:MAG: hypothetical protein ACI9E1_001315 [Cryomorphaceae bacterium]|jgi:hypothetical protein
MNSSTKVINGSNFVFAPDNFDSKYAVLNSKKVNGDVHISSIRKRCSATKDKFELFRKNLTS